MTEENPAMHDAQMSVLIVEDDPAHQLLVKRALTRPGSPFSVVHLAETSQEALEVVKQMSFDVLLVDNRIPGHRGLDLADLFRERHVDAPFVLMTSAGSEDLAVQAYRKRIADYVVKEPAFWEDLPGILSRVVMDHRAARREEKLIAKLQRTTSKLERMNAELQIQNQELSTLRRELAERDERIAELTEKLEAGHSAG